MKAERLFLETLDEIERRLQDLEHDEYNLLQVASLLRQLLLDSNPLVHAANEQTRQRIRFYVTKDRSDKILPERGAVMLIEPYRMMPPPGLGPEHAEWLKLDAFLRHRVFTLEDVGYTVRDMVDVAANSLGGRHHGRDATDAKAQALFDNNDVIGINGQPLVAAHIATIAVTALNSLLPLRMQLRFRSL